MGPTILFTQLKIILLQCFQFSATISSIQTDHLHFFLGKLLTHWFGIEPITLPSTLLLQGEEVQY